MKTWSDEAKAIVHDRRMRDHLETDYTQMPGIIRLGYTKAVAVNHCGEPMVEVDDGALIDRLEALGHVDSMPTPAELADRAATVQQTWSSSERRRRMGFAPDGGRLTREYIHDGWELPQIARLVSGSGVRSQD